MKLFNTRTHKVDNLEPINPPKVTFYSCGPTVYDTPHIGNWYTFIRYDLLYRTLNANKYDVNWVMNITDVGHLVSDADEGEDKLEKGAKREGITAWDVAKKYTEYFEKGLQRLNINQPSQLPKATDHIQEQIELIQTLEKNGHTYVIDDGVYFDTATFGDYGKMAQLDIAHLKEGARVEANQQKKNPTDFALWKFSPKNEDNNEKRDMEWESPWGPNSGKGFPGWHLECSAMAMKYLGETLDIHAGGIDHIPVHHTNEIAQSEGATGKPFANIWVHMNFILVDGKKMSKSAGTFITLEDIEKKGFDLMAFRLMVLQSHYRTEAHFSWDNLAAAQNRLNHWQDTADLRWQVEQSGTIDTDVLIKTLGDDLDTPKLLSLIDGYFDQLEDNASYPDIRSLRLIESLTGINLQQEDISMEIKQTLQDRQKARDNKDFTLSDELRDKLKKQGIEVDDTKFGQRWSRIR